VLILKEEKYFVHKKSVQDLKGYCMKKIIGIIHSNSTYRILKPECSDCQNPKKGQKSPER